MVTPNSLTTLKHVVKVLHTVWIGSRTFHCRLCWSCASLGHVTVQIRSLHIMLCWFVSYLLHCKVFHATAILLISVFKKRQYKVHIFQSLSLYATIRLVNVLLLFCRHKFVRPSCWCLWRRFESTKIGCQVTRCLYEIFRGNWLFSVRNNCVRNLAKGCKDELVVFSRKEWFLRNPEYWHVTHHAYWPWVLMPVCPFILTVMVS
jgi:hypothetical protein